MEESEGSDKMAVDLPPQTAPESFPVTVRGFDTEQHAREFAHLLGLCVRELSRLIDLNSLDGITIANDFSQALLDLDRGYETKFELKPTEEFAFGVAMTPCVMREGKLKSHILINAEVILPLENAVDGGFGSALHTLAHECAHVEISSRFDRSFPNTLLRKTIGDLHKAVRFEIIISCWDEYAATWIAAPIGRDPTSDYEQTFVLVLEVSRKKANSLISAYRVHADIEKVTAEVYKVYGDLMKFACYHLGNMYGRNLTLDDLPITKAALEGHWFSPFFERIGLACKNICSDYGKWTDMTGFEVIGDIADEIVSEGGVTISLLSDGTYYADIPYTRDTMPINF